MTNKLKSALLVTALTIGAVVGFTSSPAYACLGCQDGNQVQHQAPLPIGSIPAANNIATAIDKINVMTRYRTDNSAAAVANGPTRAETVVIATHTNSVTVATDDTSDTCTNNPQCGTRLTRVTTNLTNGSDAQALGVHLLPNGGTARSHTATGAIGEQHQVVTIDRLSARSLPNRN